MKIKVLGSGCASCHKLYEETLKAVENMGKNYEVEYISDMKVMLGYGIMTPPAIVIDEKVISQGKSLKAKDIEKLLNGVKIDENSCENGKCDCGGCC